MATYREIIYMCLDEIKAASDDSYFEEEHIMFLINKYRAVLLRQRQHSKQPVSDSNKQLIELELIEVPAMAGDSCECEYYLRSTVKIPELIPESCPKIYSTDMVQREIAYVSVDRIAYVGYNKYLQNIIYTAIGPDDYLYFKSVNPLFLELTEIWLEGLFENPQEAYLLNPDYSADNDIMDTEFPIDSSLVPAIIQMVVQELLPATYRPQDKENNASDDLSGLTVKE